jgi:putative lipoprotein
LLLIVSVIVSGCASVPFRKDPWVSTDKIGHFCASGLIAGAATAAAHAEGGNADEAFLVGMGVTLSIGLAKEIYDGHFHNRWSWKDIMWNVLGGLAGYFAARAIE